MADVAKDVARIRAYCEAAKSSGNWAQFYVDAPEDLPCVLDEIEKLRTALESIDYQFTHLDEATLLPPLEIIECEYAEELIADLMKIVRTALGKPTLADEQEG